MILGFVLFVGYFTVTIRIAEVGYYRELPEEIKKIVNNHKVS